MKPDIVKKLMGCELHDVLGVSTSQGELKRLPEDKQWELLGLYHQVSELREKAQKLSKFCT